MTQTQGFLSYTRIDDTFFSGAVTALRDVLELGVQVVTGDRGFSLFRDVEGIELGQKWQKRLDEAIAGSLLLVPVLTPSFFRSAFCRDELTKFLAHETALGRDDMVLPIYFVTVPSLEKPELTGEDPLAKEIATRQRFDWRANTNLLPNKLEVSSAVLTLCRQIAAAMERTKTVAVFAAAAATPPPAAPPPAPPRGRGDAPSPSPPAPVAPRSSPAPGSDLAVPAGAPPSRGVPGQAGAPPARPGRDEGRASEIGAATARLQSELRGQEQVQARWSVLWVDDRPDNNRYEASALREYGVHVTQAKDTETALQILRIPGARFDAVISDMSRPPDERAGHTLLRALRASWPDLPFFIYAGRRSAERAEATRSLGGQGYTAAPDELIEMVLQAIGAVSPPERGPG